MRIEDDSCLGAEGEWVPLPRASAADAVGSRDSSADGSGSRGGLNGSRAPSATNGSRAGSMPSLRANASVLRAFDFMNRWAERIFVISLPRATHRQGRIRERLAGLHYRFTRGVDKAELDRSALIRDGIYDESRTRPAYRHTRDMSLGEIGTALAHRRIYEDVVRHGWRRVIVLEDDVVPLEANVARLPDALRDLPVGWDLCYLGYLKGERVTASRRFKLASYVALSRVGLCPWLPDEVQRLRTRPFSPNLLRAGLHTHAHAYAISLDGARKLLAAQTPIAFRADSLFSWLVVGGGISGYVAASKHFEQERVLGVTPAGEVPSYIDG